MLLISHPEDIWVDAVWDADAGTMRMRDADNRTPGPGKNTVFIFLFCQNWSNYIIILIFWHRLKNAVWNRISLNVSR